MADTKAVTQKHVAALIIVGDEILNGQIQDANTAYLAKMLKSRGIKIRRVVVVPDEVDVIAKEVREASKNYPIVFTSGGVGPTHDDVTYEGVAKGLELILQEDKNLIEHLTKLFPGKPEIRRLALVPSPCELIYVKSQNEIDYAVVKAGNVYVLPGSPQYFRPGVETIVDRLEAGLPLHTTSFELALDEYALVAVLDGAAKRWAGQLAIGSYPQSSRCPRTKITLESRCWENVVRAGREILAELPRGVCLRSPAIFNREQAENVYCSTRDLDNVKRAFEILEDCYRKYTADQVLLSFNGGKDCTVVLHLVAVFTQLRDIEPPLCLYITGDSFPEVEEFVTRAAQYYGVEMLHKSGSIKEALVDVLKERSNLKACFLGTRKGDPGAHNVEAFADTDPGWPPMMRVSPIIDWTYSQVWQFLLQQKVPYCSLYDQGYTSLGHKNATTKNPLLQDPADPTHYLPAYRLVDDSTERHGRE